MKTIVMFSATLAASVALAQPTTPAAVRDATPSLPTESRQPFNGRDVNGDGRISPTEAATSSQSFSTADKNGDGSLDRNEYSQLMRNAESSGRPSTSTPAPRTEYPAIRGDGAASSSTSIPPVAPAPGTAPPAGTLPPAHGSAPPASTSGGSAPGSSLPPAAPAPTAPTP